MTNAELVSFALGFGLASMVILTIGALLLRKWYNEVFNELEYWLAQEYGENQ